MDQVKQYLRLAAKYHFWILVGVVSILTLGSWYMASAGLSKEFTDNSGKIKAGESAINAVQSTTNHANATHLQQIDEIIRSYKANLRRLWEKQYVEQGVNLQWPVETPSYRGLTEEFVEQVRPLRPIETTVPYQPENKSFDKLKDNYKSQYVNFVKTTELPRLARIIGAVWHPAEEEAGGAVGGGGVGGERPALLPTGEKRIVEWHAENQKFLQDTRFDWRLEPSGRPSTLQILYAQEDLWVLETLINIIANTNQDADAPHNAVVKEIKYVKIGADAVGFSGQVMRLSAPAVGPDGMPTGGLPGNAEDPTRAGALPGAVPGGLPGEPGAAVVSRDPAEGRYVDVNYQPIPPDRLRLAFTSTKSDEAFLAVAKRMPVRMHLVVDQRYLNRLLAECGNSNLIVEIRQLRMNRPVFDGTSSGGGGFANPIAGGGGEAGRGGFAFERGGGGFGRGPSGGGRESSGGTEETVSPHEVDIELYGIVYIYNPVNEGLVSALGTEAGETPPAAVETPAPTDPAPMPVEPAPQPVDPMPVEPAPMPVEPAPMPVEPMPAPMNDPVAPPAAGNS
jgi:hypothetical protein